MLSEKDYETAALNNLKNWEWDIKQAYPMEKEEAQAVIKVLEKHKAQQMMNKLQEIKC